MKARAAIGTILPILGLSVSISFALDISGKVMDKRFTPVAGAKVCSQSAPNTCVLSGADGAFHWQGTVGLQTVSAVAPSVTGSQWFRADGRSLKNESPGFGFVRPVEAQSPQAHASEPGFLSKAAAVPALIVSKTGYATTPFQPAAETEKDDRILLGGEGESVALGFNGKNLDGWTQIPAASWNIKDSAMASLGVGRGVVYTAGDYLDFRAIFSVRQLSGNHAPCVLFFSQRPPQGLNGLDALGAVQWQPPTKGGWDYRPGKNNNGAPYFTVVSDPGLNRNQWSQCELLVHGSTGTARMACCAQSGAGPCKGKEILRFKDPAAAGRKGPFALQMHNAGIHDEYRDISIETNPKSDSLFITQ